jgi:hypothetical protein
MFQKKKYIIYFNNKMAWVNIKNGIDNSLSVKKKKFGWIGIIGS